MMKQRHFVIVDNATTTQRFAMKLGHWRRMLEYIIGDWRREIRFRLFVLRYHFWPYGVEKELEHMWREYDAIMQRVDALKSAGAIYETKKRWEEAKQNAKEQA
jgi:hypothetical protein